MTSPMPIGQAPGSGAPAPPTPPKPETGSREQFLQLLVSQLKNQDPLNPLSGTEWVAQLAQFSTVEQLLLLRGDMAATADRDARAALLSETAYAATLIGREVVVEGDRVSIANDTPGKVSIRVDGEGGAATLTLRDATGRVVATRDIALRSGLQTVSIDGVPAGEYRYSVALKKADRSATRINTYTIAVVSGFSVQDGAVWLQVGGTSVPLSSVIEVRAIKTSDSSNN
ncbi:MAG TPA: flagellar hook capping FlgD N-terminal domain-containing protein [Gemmatimonadaceae bacterium]|nr:flagellar hook capping FlgD N-terminal domain-containing protein [Gemmatimonadaceae bacterium]